jgi:hypothetical protein
VRSATLISNVTDAVLEEVRAWQDALVVKMRDEGTVQNRAVYVAIGINMEGRKPGARRKARKHSWVMSSARSARRVGRYTNP